MVTTTKNKSAGRIFHVRLREDVREQAMRNAEAIGVPLSTLINAFVVRFAAEGVVPFALQVPERPNTETRAAIAEGRELYKAGKTESVDDFLADMGYTE